MDRFKDWLSNLQWDFVGKRYVFGGLSVLVVLGSWALFFGMGPKWSIDFTGGVEMHIKFCKDASAATCVPPQNNPITIQAIRGALVQMGLQEDVVQRVKLPQDQEYVIRIQDPTFGSEDLQAKVQDRLRQAYGPDWITGVRVDAEVGARMAIAHTGNPVSGDDIASKLCPSGDCALDGLQGVTTADGREPGEVVVKLPSLGDVVQKRLRSQLDGADFKTLAIDAVGPKVGNDLRTQSAISIALTLLLVLIYVAFRFDLAFAPGAILALFHDVSVTLGVLIVTGTEISLAIVGALLTIVGYSLNDTIVIYDRIRENRELYPRVPTPDLINTSVNETLVRTVTTGVTTFFAVIPFVLLTSGVIKDFSFAMLLGIVVGTYSTIYVASPMILVMEDLKPWLAKWVLPSMAQVPGPNAIQGSTPPVALSATEARRRERAAKQSAGPGDTP